MDAYHSNRHNPEPREAKPYGWTLTSWQTTFDLIGLAAYFTLMTGEVPDGKLLQEARRETGPSAEIVLGNPKKR
jgi:hypothetical protein